MIFDQNSDPPSALSHLFLELDHNVPEQSEISHESANISTKRAIKESLCMNSTLFLISLTKIAAFLFGIFVRNREFCQGSLKIWLFAMLTHDILHGISLALLIRLVYKEKSRVPGDFLENSLDSSFRNFDLTFHSQVRRRFGQENSLNGFDISKYAEKNSVFTGYLLEICRFGYLLVFLFGNVIFFSEITCTRENSPFFWTLCLIFLVMGYLYYAIPLVLFLLTCLYLPFGLLILYCFPQSSDFAGNASGEGQRQAFIQSLQGEICSEDQRDGVCAICMMEFEENCEIVKLPCNENHFFHEKCIKSWLKKRAVCPICRQKFAESFSVME